MTLSDMVDIEGSFPVQLRPRTNVEWSSFSSPELRSELETLLLRAGAILFRGFTVDTIERFDRFAAAVSTSPAILAEESSPRSGLGGQVFTSTDYPAHLPIQFHNEYSYSGAWPMKLFFACLRPAEKGGATPIASSRGVLTRIPSDIREKFRSLGVRYQRNFFPNMGVAIERAFGTSSRSEIENYCKQVGISYRWRDDGGLTTTQFGEAIVQHPVTREEVWFNHAFFFNVRAIEPLSLRDALLLEDEADLSTNTYYGDGTPIEAETIEAIREAFQAEAYSGEWERGDVLLIDNMLCAHARAPFEGQRQIAVVMTDAVQRASVVRRDAMPSGAA
jgi:alpha-ketoglutarate-dependent taurine dioxygenase